VNLPASKPIDASSMFSTNVANYLAHLIQEGELRLDREDELIAGPLVTHAGEVVNEAVKSSLES
jgi:NAD(P) transhydrogenase subunit alpha